MRPRILKITAVVSTFFLLALLFYNADRVTLSTWKVDRQSLTGSLRVNAGRYNNRLDNNMLATSQDGDCTTSPTCLGRLSAEDKKLYDQCLSRLEKYAVPKPNSYKCHFLFQESRRSVALISFPGSGNTWTRTLLEATSGVCTGSTMCDMSLRYEGFIGENINSGTVLVVKTHNATVSWGAMPSSFSSAILLIRNPLDALVSEWNRRAANDFHVETVHITGTHTKETTKSHFGTNKKWNDFVYYQAKKWREIINSWLVKGRKAGKKVLVVHYEKLVSDRQAQIQRMLDFLGVKFSKQLDKEFNTFQRQHKKEPFDPYTKYQRKYVLAIIKHTIKDLQESRTDTNLTQYLS